MSVGSKRAVLTVLAVAAFVVAIPPGRARAWSPARLNCTVNGTGQWGIFLPDPSVAQRTYWSRFWFKFVGGFSGTGYDWRHTDAVYWGDSQNGTSWTQAGGYRTLQPGKWAFWGTVNTGTMYAWEYQLDTIANTYNWNNLGSCNVWQFTVFYPFG